MRSHLVLIPSPPAGTSLDVRNDDELMLLVHGGSRDAIATLARRYMARIVRFATKLTGDRHAAEEIAQDTWLHVWATRERYESQGKFAVYIYTIARNRCRNHVRDYARRARHVVREEEHIHAAADGAPDQIQTMIDRERQRRLDDAALLLPEKLREALTLRVSEELDYADIAHIVHANESTVRSRVFHAIKTLRAALEGGS